MRKSLGVKTYAFPQPVFIIAAYGTDGKPNCMNAAWGGISGDSKISMCLSPGHKTVKDILETKAFTISMADAAHVTECDYVGVVSGNDEPDKFEKAGFHALRSDNVNAPLIEELPLALECRLESYDENTHCMIGEIVNVSADEKILDAEGNINVSALGVITYDPANHTYIKLGEKVGNAFKDGLSIK